MNQMSFPLQSEVRLPDFLEDCLSRFTDAAGRAEVMRRMRRPEVALSVPVMRSVKATRLSFADLLLAKIQREGWRVILTSQECAADGSGRFVYRIETPTHRFTYIARAYAWDGKEKVGRRADGALRDMFGALFVNEPTADRIAREFETFDLKDTPVMRTDADVIGWTPANRSARHFDQVLQCLLRGEQPSIDGPVQYLMRNGGFQSSGRNGSISYKGISADHPLAHPFFADLFAIWLLRNFQIDLVNALARVGNPAAAQLDREFARKLGIGNSSGQGMCVALQRWPHWVSAWVVVRELAIAYAKAQPITAEGRAAVLKAKEDGMLAYETLEPQVEEDVVPNEVIIAEMDCLAEKLSTAPLGQVWGDFAEEATCGLSLEGVEQFHSFLLEAVPEFCDAVAGWLPLGAARERVLQPEMSVGAVRDILRRNYAWALQEDRSLSRSYQHFWYHSVDNGEQRRGDRVIDPHEEFESFIDHVGLIQRLASALTSYPDNACCADVVLDAPELHYAISRVQYLDGLAYSEIRAPLAHRDFHPSHLIRFFLSSLGIRSSLPLSIRYVRGTFFQGVPLPADIVEMSNAPVCQGEMR